MKIDKAYARVVRVKLKKKKKIVNIDYQACKKNSSQLSIFLSQHKRHSLVNKNLQLMMDIHDSMIP